MGKLKEVFGKIGEEMNPDSFGSKDERIISKQKEAWIPSALALGILYVIFSITYLVNKNYGVMLWICLGISITLLGTLAVTTVLYKNKDEALHMRYIDINVIACATVTGVITILAIIRLVSPTSFQRYGIDLTPIILGVIVFAISYSITVSKKGAVYIYSDKREKKIIVRKIIINAIMMGIGFQLLELIPSGFDFSKFEIGEFILSMIIFLIISTAFDLRMMKSSNIAAEKELEEFEES
ncbi:MAG: hypothetical protein RR486_06865 [Clostridium sp.]|uniref:hypothetical protein n=1 Tax=Clostridium sp. TaxID=1506 RepID=UPI003056FE68